MSILIKYQTYNNYNSVEVTNLKALEQKDLPEEYLKQKFNIFYEELFSETNKELIKKIYTKTVFGADKLVLRADSHYEKEDFIKRLRFIRKCGNKLHKMKSIGKVKENKIVKKAIQI